MKKLICFLLCLLPLSCAYAMEEEGLYPPTSMEVNLPDTQLLNVRKQPKKSASTWGTVRGGDDVYVTAIEGAWATVDYDDETGYVLLRYLEITANVACTIVSNGRVRVRVLPGGSIDGFMQDGDSLMVLAWRFDDEGTLWARTATGFVMADYLELITTEEGQEDILYAE